MGSPDNEPTDSDSSRSLAENVKWQRYFHMISANWEQLQVAYPIWDTSLLTELDMVTMEQLFTDANLLDVWEARRDELDTPGILWDDVLSLGEQQRLQFCRTGLGWCPMDREFSSNFIV